MRPFLAAALLFGACGSVSTIQAGDASGGRGGAISDAGQLAGGGGGGGGVGGQDANGGRGGGGAGGGVDDGGASVDAPADAPECPRVCRTAPVAVCCLCHSSTPGLDTCCENVDARGECCGFPC